MNEGLGSWTGRRRRKSGSKTAILFGGAATTYAELDERSGQLAGAFAAAGVRPGDRVAYLGDNHPSFLECLFATAWLGAIFVPLNTRLAAPELNFILRDSGATILVTSAAYASLGDLAGTDSAVRHRMLAGGPNPSETTERPPEISVGLDDPAMILYTSGTTGRPKGALLSHGNFTWNAVNVLVDYDLVSTDRALMVSPLFHAASLGMGALPSLLKGATVVLEERFDPARALRLIEQEQITFMSGVPTTFQMMCEHPDWAGTDLGSLRRLTCGGSPIPLRVLAAFEDRGLSFTGGYGMTEASPGVTSLAPDRSREKAGSAGLPHFFTRVRLVDLDDRPVGPGEVGEVQVRGPNVVGGYWNLPAETAAAFADDRWFRSGDLAYCDEEGYLYIADRAKDMIISGGENIYPAEVESVILELGHVSAAAVVGTPDERWGEVPIAIVTLQPGHQLSLEDLRTHLDGRIARYKIPKRLVVADELPRTASGKIRKAQLRERYGPTG